jgi:hypothetical protein
MSSNVPELKVGARAWFDSGAWTVCEVLGAEVRLRDSDDRYRLTAIDELLGRAPGLGCANAPAKRLDRPRYSSRGRSRRRELGDHT